jgi:hypothetical protein
VFLDRLEIVAERLLVDVPLPSDWLPALAPEPPLLYSK